MMRYGVSSLIPILLAAGLIGGAPGAAAQSAAQKGEQIAIAADESDRGYGDFTADGQMILRGSTGATSERRFELRSLETGGDSKTLVIFDWPGDIRDTALLTHSFANRSDNQWLFLPSIRRAKRISGAIRSGSFVGSEFAYEDMVNQRPAKFRHEWVRDEPCPTSSGLQCHVVDRTPRQSSGYSLQRVWFDAAELRVLMVEFFDRRGARLKTMTSSGFRRLNGRFWRPGRVRMVNHLTGKSTDLVWSNYRFGRGLTEGQFSVNALRNVR